MCHAAHRFDGGAGLVRILHVLVLRDIGSSGALHGRSVSNDPSIFYIFINSPESGVAGRSMISSVEAKGRETQHSVP